MAILALVSGAFGPIVEFFMYVSIPLAALAVWAARNDTQRTSSGQTADTLYGRQQNAQQHASTRTQQRGGQWGQGQQQTEASRHSTPSDHPPLTNKPTLEDPLDAWREWHEDTPDQVADQRADRVADELRKASAPLTVKHLATRLRWQVDAVMSGLLSLSDKGLIREEFPDDHDLAWRYVWHTVADAYESELASSPTRHSDTHGSSTRYSNTIDEYSEEFNVIPHEFSVPSSSDSDVH